MDRLLTHAPTLNPVIPLVGRIDAANFVGSADYVGTGWLVDRTTVVTNRHVAELISQRGPDGFTFAAGRFGDPLQLPSIMATRMATRASIGSR